MLAETGLICSQNIPILDVPFLYVSKENNLHDVLDSNVTIQTSSFQSVVSCSDSVKNVAYGSKTAEFVPKIRSGSYADIGYRLSMDDEHIKVDDLSIQLDSHFKCPFPSAFYGVFDGHGGPEAANYVKRNAMKLILEDSAFPKDFDLNDVFLQELENSHRRAFLKADLLLADECSISGSCGTTVLTALVLGRLLLVANAGDCRAVLCRNGRALEMSQDHRPSCLSERKRIEDLGGFVHDGYLNGMLSVTRSLGDWEMKLPCGSRSPLSADPDFRHILLTEEDEFLIIGCDGLWDVMSGQVAVSFVRRGLRRHDDPSESAKELVLEAMRLDTSDNVTVIVVCFACELRVERMLKPRSRFCGLSEEARNKLRSLLEGN